MNMMTSRWSRIKLRESITPRSFPDGLTLLILFTLCLGLIRNRISRFSLSFTLNVSLKKKISSFLETARFYIPVLDLNYSFFLSFECVLACGISLASRPWSGACWSERMSNICMDSVFLSIQVDTSMLFLLPDCFAQFLP